MKRLMLIYWGLTFILLTDTILYLFKGISFPGYWIDWSLFWCWLVLTFVVILGQFRKRWAIGYAVTLFILIVISLFPMGVPFLTIVAFAIDPVDNSKQIDSRIRLQETAKSVIAIPTIEAVKNYYLFEKIIGTTDFYFYVNESNYRLDDADAIVVIPNHISDSLKIEFKFKDRSIIRTF